KAGTSIGLFSTNGTLIDFVSFGPQTSDISMGRYPDGAANISILPRATPQTNNAAPNTPPVLLAAGTKFIYSGQTLNFFVQAIDTDLPPQALTYSLDPGSPTNATIHPATGLITWTPLASQAPSTNLFVLRATDNGIPSLNTTEPLTVIVASLPSL